MQKIEVKYETFDSITYAVVDTGPAILLVVNPSCVDGQPSWVREFLTNHLLRTVRTPPTKIAKVIDLDEFRELVATAEHTDACSSSTSQEANAH